MIDIEHTQNMSAPAVTALESVMMTMTLKIPGGGTCTREQASAALVGLQNPEQVLKFLQGNGHEATMKVIELGMQDVFADGQITVSDVPRIIKMVSDVASGFNDMNNDSRPGLRLTKADLIPLIETILGLIARVVVGPAQFQIVSSILSTCVQVLVIDVSPIAFGIWTSCFDHRTKV